MPLPRASSRRGPKGDARIQGSFGSLSETVVVQVQPVPATVEVESRQLHHDARWLGAALAHGARCGRKCPGPGRDLVIVQYVVASVNQQGLVTGEGVGEVVIRAAVDGVVGEATRGRGRASFRTY
jgi:hypothetical protein